MSRALLAGALLMSGCSLLVSVDGLSGGAAQTKAPSEGGAPAEKDAGKSDATPTTPDGAVASRYRAAVLADSPSVYLRFGDAPGTTTVRSEVGTTTAKYGGGMALGTPGALGGDSDTAITFTKGIIVMPPGVECAGTSECAIEYWLRITTYQDGYGWIVDHQLWDVRRGYNMEMSGGGLNYERWSGDGTSSTAGTLAQLALDEWHHVVAVMDSDGQRIYVDGEQKEKQPGKAIPSIGSEWTIGANSCFDCGDRQWFEGSLDELAIYEHSLSADRITAHRDAARAP